MSDGSRYLLVAQPGGSFVYLRSDHAEAPLAADDSNYESQTETRAKSKPIPMGHRR